jgi:hypothetical protein
MSHPESHFRMKEKGDKVHLVFGFLSSPGRRHLAVDEECGIVPSIAMPGLMLL